MTVTFRTLLDNETFCQVCSENGFSASWDSDARAVALEDLSGRYFFRAGLTASMVLKELSKNPTATGLQELIVAVISEDTDEYF